MSGTAPHPAGSWGAGWLRAMEGAALDTARLARGRAYADPDGARGAAGAVSAPRVGPGRVLAYVRGSRARPYRAEWRLPTLSEEEWTAFLTAVAGRPVLAAALLDGELPWDVVPVAQSAGVRLLPGSEDLLPACSCPDRGHPCKHAAALGYGTGALLDADPWALLLMRGRSAEAVRAEVARLGAARTGPSAERPRTCGDGTSPRRSRGDADGSPGDGRGPRVTRLATEVFAASVRPPLPEPQPLPDVASGPGAYPELPGAPDADALAFLAADAAVRARCALSAVPVEHDGAGPRGVGEYDPLPDLSRWHDTVRLAATHPQLTGRRTLSARFAGLARSAGRDPLELARAAAAWRQGGPAGLAVLEAAWDPPAGDFDRGRSALAGLGIAMTIHRNQLTHTTRPVQLRFGGDGRWYPYRDASGPGSADRGGSGPDGRADAADWWPEGPSAADPVQALTGLGQR
ncbi:SWIM zinc finger family protein [Streptomyces sp. AA1529]|uniref:SWIM zinc finger family protein n=1 Tax=Streptomyces sp. AA1529 TaxID=1203257 RepID=UPI00031F2BD6|nr:SWIM zinc finger family protein [Streptomyces sp. AA1529]